MSNNAKLLIIDVGHGNSNIIQEDSSLVIVDTGLKGRLREFLSQNGIQEIECVILSHSDADHISGLSGLLSSNIKINSVILNSDAEKDTEAWRDLIFALDGAHDRGEIDFKVGLTDGQFYVKGFTHTQLEIVAPTRLLAAYGVGAKNLDDKTITSNSLSAVVKVSYQGTSVALLTGDMDDVTLDEITRKKTDIQAKILVFPHHGGLPGNSNPKNFTQRLMDSVKPETVLFSHGREKHLNPSDIIVSEIISKVPNVKIGCTQLSKRCAKNLPNAQRTFHLDIFSAGKKDGLCCAGTMEIPLSHGSVINATMELHQEFIKINVPDAICQRNSTS